MVLVALRLESTLTFGKGVVCRPLLVVTTSPLPSFPPTSPRRTARSAAGCSGFLFGLAYLRNGVLQVGRFRLGRRCCRYGFRCRRQRYSRLCGLRLLRVSLALGLLDVVLHADWRRGLLLRRLVQGEAASAGG